MLSAAACHSRAWACSPASRTPGTWCWGSSSRWRGPWDRPARWSGPRCHTRRTHPDIQHEASFLFCVSLTPCHLASEGGGLHIEIEGGWPAAAPGRLLATLLHNLICPGHKCHFWHSITNVKCHNDLTLPDGTLGHTPRHAQQLDPPRLQGGGQGVIVPGKCQ